jgi:pilus assembly protein FimV
MRNPQARAAPEPKKPEDRERKPGSRASGDPATKWAAIGALAAVAAAIIALLAYAIPRPAATPVSAPAAPVATSYAFYSASHPPPPAPRATQAPSPAPAAAIPESRPAGCDAALAAISTYHQAADPTTNSEASAATQARESLLAASKEANDAAVSTDIGTVAADFSAMRWILEGALDQSYSAAVQQANSDIKTLDTACAIS